MKFSRKLRLQRGGFVLALIVIALGCCVDSWASEKAVARRLWVEPDEVRVPAGTHVLLEIWAAFEDQSVRRVQTKKVEAKSETPITRFVAKYQGLSAQARIIADEKITLVDAVFDPPSVRLCVSQSTELRLFGVYADSTRKTTRVLLREKRLRAQRLGPDEITQRVGAFRAKAQIEVINLEEVPKRVVALPPEVAVSPGGVLVFGLWAEQSDNSLEFVKQVSTVGLRRGINHLPFSYAGSSAYSRIKVEDGMRLVGVVMESGRAPLKPGETVQLQIVGVYEDSKGQTNRSLLELRDFTAGKPGQYPIEEKVNGFTASTSLVVEGGRSVRGLWTIPEEQEIPLGSKALFELWAKFDDGSFGLVEKKTIKSEKIGTREIQLHYGELSAQAVLHVVRAKGVLSGVVVEPALFWVSLGEQQKYSVYGLYEQKNGRNKRVFLRERTIHGERPGTHYLSEKYQGFSAPAVMIVLGNTGAKRLWLVPSKASVSPGATAVFEAWAEFSDGERKRVEERTVVGSAVGKHAVNVFFDHLVAQGLLEVRKDLHPVALEVEPIQPKLAANDVLRLQVFTVYEDPEGKRLRTFSKLRGYLAGAAGTYLFTENLDSLAVQTPIVVRGRAPASRLVIRPQNATAYPGVRTDFEILAEYPDGKSELVEVRSLKEDKPGIYEFLAVYENLGAKGVLRVSK